MKTRLFVLLSLASAAPVTFAQTATALPDVSPITPGQHIAINIPQQRLFLYSDGKLSKIYPIAVGKATTQTTLGRHIIGAKAYNPVWHIPKSIQKELNNGQTTVPPGPNNPLGPVFVRLGDPKLGLGIHGTSAPASVPGVRSHGCVRMKSPDALEFAKTIVSGTAADVIYQQAALNADAGNNLWLAAFGDPYSRNSLDKAALKKSMEAWAKAHGKTIHSKRVDLVLQGRTGKLNCITCGSSAGKITGQLQSLAWTSGSGSLTKASMAPPKPKAVPADAVLPEGSEIEVDADTTESAASAPALPQSALPKAASQAASQPMPKPAAPTTPAAIPQPALTQPASTTEINLNTLF